MMTKLWFSNHTTWFVEVIAALVVIAVIVIVVLRRRKPRNLPMDDFQDKWHEVQQLCGSRETWPLAVINADALLDEALKKLKYKGKTMGERLVAAQHDIKDNDSIWFAHKLRNKLVSEEIQKLKKKEVMDVLVGIRAALRNLGALKGEKIDTAEPKAEK